MRSKHTLVTSYIITYTTHRCLQILTSSLEFFSSPSGRNWKVLIVKRRVWPWGEGGRGSNSTVFWGAGSKGLGHLGSDIRCSSQLESRTKRIGNIFLSSSSCENNLNFYDLYGEFFFFFLVLFRQMFWCRPIVKKQPHSFSWAGIGHTVVHQQHQAGIWGVEQTYF